MSNVIPSPTNPAEPPIGTVRITAGTVTTSTDPRDVGRFMYFLTLHEPDGGQIAVWDGYSHDEALAAAREWYRDGAAVIDETVTTFH